jgi:outer membrane protein assembly factor BamD (BamD/ComL family)
MKKNLLISFFISLFLTGCNTWKQAMISKGTKDEAIKNAIIDFLHKGEFKKAIQYFLFT